MAGNLQKLDASGNIQYLPIPIYTLTKDINDNVYVASRGYIAKIAPDGKYKILAGKLQDLDKWGHLTRADGVGDQATFGPIQAITADRDGNVYVDESNMPDAYIRKIDAKGKVTTLIKARIANFSNNWALNAFAVNSNGEIFLGGRGVIIKISPEGKFETFAGEESQTLGWSKDGQGKEASFGAEITRLAIDAHDNLYAVTHSGFSFMRKITPHGFVTTLAGKYAKQSPIDEDVQPDELVDGSERGNSFYPHSNIDVDSDGNVYFLQCNVNALRKLSKDGQVTTLIRGELNPSGWGY